MDAGTSAAVTDIFGSVVCSWNSRGVCYRYQYDELRREVAKLLVQGPGAEGGTIVVRAEYGESAAADEAARGNLRGQLWRVYDQAGLHVNSRFDLRGHGIETQFFLADEYKSVLDWSVRPDKKPPRISPRPFMQTTRLNNFGEPVVSIDAKGNTTRRTFSRVGHVVRVHFQHAELIDDEDDGAEGEGVGYLTKATFHADGLPETRHYGNGVHTEYTYHPLSRRLVRERTTNGKGAVLQDLTHTYDAVGHRVRTRDGAAQTQYFRNCRVEAAWEYRYDGVGQLVEAWGRGRRNPTYRYRETYEYDLAGNLTSMTHGAPEDRFITGWTRRYHYEEPSALGSDGVVSNRLSRTTVGSAEERYGYDAADAGAVGCMTSMPRFSVLRWNADNMLTACAGQRVLDGTPEITYFVYNYAGRRVRKVTESSSSSSPSSTPDEKSEAPRKTRDTLYLDGVEVQMRMVGDGTTPAMTRTLARAMGEDLGDVIALVESASDSGALLDRYQAGPGLELDDDGRLVTYEEYSPFGTAVYSAVRRDVEAPRAYRFARYEHDRETGLYHCGARYYMPWLGRWTSPDPLGDVNGPNLFAYCVNNPVGADDHDGTSFNKAGQRDCAGLPYTTVKPGTYKTVKFRPIRVFREKGIVPDWENPEYEPWEGFNRAVDFQAMKILQKNNVVGRATIKVSAPKAPTYQNAFRIRSTSVTRGRPPVSQGGSESTQKQERRGKSMVETLTHPHRQTMDLAGRNFMQNALNLLTDWKTVPFGDKQGTWKFERRQLNLQCEKVDQCLKMGPEGADEAIREMVSYWRMVDNLDKAAATADRLRPDFGDGSGENAIWGKKRRDKSDEHLNAMKEDFDVFYRAYALHQRVLGESPAPKPVLSRKKKAVPVGPPTLRAAAHEQRFTDAPPLRTSLAWPVPTTSTQAQIQTRRSRLHCATTTPDPEATAPVGMRSHSSGSSQDDAPPNPPSADAVHVKSSSARFPTTESQSPAHHPGSITVDRRRSADARSSLTLNRRSGSINWRSPIDSRSFGNGSPLEKGPPLPERPCSASSSSLGLALTAGASNAANGDMGGKVPETRSLARRPPWRSPWAISLAVLVASLIGIAFLLTVVRSAATRQLDPKGCRMSYMRPSYAKLTEFDTEHTRLASKYSLYLYREQGVDHDTKVRGVPVLFIPGNAGSYKQVRPIAAEAANYFHDVLQHDETARAAGVRNLDFFTVDFNEDITAFHGQTLLDQAEYLNEAVRYILSLYLDPRISDRDPDLPDPTSVIVLGHSMGGVVARAMLIMPNYQANSINTIITMSAPHARPPVSFDGQIVQTYKDINDYWRRAYSQQWANNNPLWHVTLVSIAGGGLDTVVPSDYASVESLVPDTHGFTVFTTSIPHVWTSMDHQAILWCDQFRKVVAQALYNVIDVHRASQTKPRAERMRVFKRWFLTGMESVAEKTAPNADPTTLLTVDDNSDSIIAEGERLVLRDLGTAATVRAHLMPIPPSGSPGRMRFTLLTDTRLDRPGENGKLEVLFCSVIPSQPSQAWASFASQIDLSKGKDSAGTTRLACRNAAPDVVPLPASTSSTRFPFYADGEKEIKPFSFLEYGVDDISEHQFVAVIEKATTPTRGFVIAEFSDHIQSHQTRLVSLRRLLTFGLGLRLPADRPMVTEVKVPSLQSSLLAYNLRVTTQACDGRQRELFAPLVRQYLSEPYESKYFVNVREATVSLHGVAPYVPPPLARRPDHGGLSFQFWTDPTCRASVDVDLTVDFLGSLGKLYIRYRTVFAAFPIFIVALVLREQFRVYDATGSFITFSESLDLCLKKSIPLMLASLTLLTLTTSTKTPAATHANFWHWGNGTLPAIDFHQNDLLIGTADPLFLFLIPLIGIVCVGVCTVVHYLALALTHLIGAVTSLVSFRPAWVRNEDRRKPSPTPFPNPSPRRRMVTTAVLLLLVSTVVPYQFAYLVACLVQLFTIVRAQRVASELRSTVHCNFYNYAHSVFILMLWILPINLPTFVVWVHNLAVHWLTPFTSHHNVLSVMPFVMLVETLTTGKMIPPFTSQLRHVTSLVLFSIAIYAAVYGVSYAYTLHYLVNILAMWLTIVHSTADSWSLAGLSQLYAGDGGNRKRGKEP
ncbi:hypothetical protein VTJ49DRAFT_4670 [Mycothermus thermophilus]|uniref:GPI inositol-deacylase n=1 Tax=Humicola insolens TaxID=85995 RepID=A0ABR3VLA0_HUMIN